jgi:hypothetical protein
MFVTRLLGALQFSSLMNTKDPDGRAESEPWRPAVGLAQPQPVKHSEPCSQVQAGVRFLYLFSSQELPNHPHEVYQKEVSNMPITREFTIRLEDRPGTLGKLCQTLAEQDINILAYQQFPHEKGKGSVHLVVDNPDKTRTTLDRQGVDYNETEVAKLTLANRSGELARVASRLGDQGINIDYGYSGAEPGANASFLILGVTDAGKAVKLIEKAAAAGTTT